MFAQDSRGEAPQCHAHSGIEVTGMIALELRELGDHRRRPEGAKVVGNPLGRLLVGEAGAVGRDLPGHPGEGLDAHG